MRARTQARWLILALLWVGLVEARTISIPAGDASLTLRLLVRRTHTSFLTGLCTLKGVRTHEVRHARDIQTALDVMLAGTGLTIHWTAPRFMGVDDERPGAKPIDATSCDDDPSAASRAAARSGVGHQEPLPSEGSHRGASAGPSSTGQHRSNTLMTSRHRPTEAFGEQCTCALAVYGERRGPWCRAADQRLIYAPELCPRR